MNNEKIQSIYNTQYKTFTEEDYKELQSNIIAYKNGSHDAAEYIIAVFHRFIKKYTTFICGNEYTGSKDNIFIKKDKSVSRFINLFISKEDKEKCNNANERNYLFMETCEKIKSLFSKYEYNDIYSELVCVLLNMANKYKITKPGDKYHKDNGTFHMYVNKCFHFDAYNALKKIIKDPIIYMENFSIEEDITDEYENYSSKTNNNDATMFNYTQKSFILKDTDTDKIFENMVNTIDRERAIKNTDKLTLKEEDVDINDLSSLNFNWTNGVTCGEVFKDLSSYEREIIVLSYAQGKTDTEIAQIYGCHRTTLIKHKKIAIQKIQQSINKKQQK